MLVIRDLAATAMIDLRICPRDKMVMYPVSVMFCWESFM